MLNTPGVHGIAVAHDLHRGFTSNGEENSVTVFNTKTLKELARVPVGTRPDAIIFDPATNRVFTFNGGSQDATAIDAKKAKVVGTVALGGRPEYAVADEKGEVFVNIVSTDEIVAIDSRTLTVKNRWSLAPGDRPTGLTMDRKNRRLFAVCGNEMMIVMDADSGRVISTPSIGKGPDAATFDPQTGMAFSSNGRDGTLTVVHEASPFTFNVLATVPTQTGARTMALDSKTHLIYLATADFVQQPSDYTPPASGGAPAGAERQYHAPNIVPNSFVILVFEKSPAQRQQQRPPHGSGGGWHHHGGGGMFPMPM